MTTTPPPPPPRAHNTIYFIVLHTFHSNGVTFLLENLLILELWGWQPAKGKRAAAQRRFCRGLCLVGVFFCLALPLDCQTAGVCL